MKIFKLHTQNLHGYNVKFSPQYSRDYLACVASTNYGLAGSSKLLVFECIGDDYSPTYKCSWTDALFDLTWKPLTNDLIATGSGDGKIQIWSFRLQEAPCGVMCAHSKEVSSVEWCRQANDTVLSASWDGTAKLWDILTGKQLGLFLGHESIIYEAAWSPHLFNIFASVGADANIRVWDIRQPELSSQKINGHMSDILTIDWSVLDEHLVATGSVDNLIKGWDLRYPESPVFQIAGHAAAIRHVKFSPFQRNVLSSVSYDFSTRMWDWMTSSLLYLNEEHTEFVYGLDYSLSCHKVADCSWDGTIHLYEDVNFYYQT